MNNTETKELLLLLLRPSISKIFLTENTDDNSPIDADVIINQFGIWGASAVNKHMIERLPILCISESATVGYTFPMILDLRLLLGQVAHDANPPIDYPLGLFTNRDVMVFSDGMYTIQLCHYDLQKALIYDTMGKGNFQATHLIYASTVTEEGMMENLRRLEATAKTLLTPTTPEPTTLPKLPSEIINGWQHGFLEPLFKHVREYLAQPENIKKANEPFIPYPDLKKPTDEQK